MVGAAQQSRGDYRGNDYKKLKAATRYSTSHDRLTHRVTFRIS